MDEISLKLIKKHNGAVLADYCQADDERLRGDTLTSGGWCLAVTIHWLRLITTGGDFEKWVNSEEAVPSLRFIMARQAATSSVASSLTSAKSWGSVLGQTQADTVKQTGLAHRDHVQRSYTEIKKHGYVFVGGGEWLQLGSFTGRLTEVHDAGVHHYMVLHLIKASGSGHTLGAIVKPDGSASIMDPNIGHIGFGKISEAESWLTEFGSNPGLNYLPMRRLNTEVYRL